MQPVELRARREGLGLTPEQVTHVLEPKVALSTLQEWEEFPGNPQHLNPLITLLCDLESIREAFSDEMIDQVELGIKQVVGIEIEADISEYSLPLDLLDAQEFKIITFTTDEHFWIAHPEYTAHVPAAIHRNAADRSRLLLSELYGAKVILTDWSALSAEQKAQYHSLWEGYEAD